MNFTALKSHLSRLAPVLHTRTPLPALSSVKLTGGGGFLVMEASNLEQYMKIIMPYDGPALGCCVGLKRLMSVPVEGEVSIAQNAHGIAIKGSGLYAKLETLPPDEFPAAPKLEGNELALEADFSDALKWVAKAAAGEKEKRLFLQAVRFGSYGMIASDGRRMNRATFPDLGGINVPATSISMFSPMLVNGATVRWDDRLFAVEAGDTMFATRLIGDSSYPDSTVGGILRDEKGTAWKIFPKEISKLVASLPQSMSAPWIDFVSENEVLTISSSDGGNVTEFTTLCAADGRFRCSREFVIDMLSGFSGEQTLLVEETKSTKQMGSTTTEIKGSVLRIRTPDRSATLSGMTYQ